MNSIHDPRYRRVIEHLRETRRDCGLTQQQVASVLDWGRTVISNCELGQRRADLLEIYLLARVYGLRLSDLEHLLQGDGDPATKEP